MWQSVVRMWLMHSAVLSSRATPMRKPALLLTIALLANSAGAQQPRVSLDAADLGKITFASAGSIVKGGEAERYVVADESVALAGELQFPAGRGPFPVVILAHTCAGLGYGEVT